MSTEHSINFRGFDFDFKYNHSSGSRATLEDPEEYPEWDIFDIKLNGIDACELLDAYIDEFEEAVIENLISYNY